MTTGKNIALTRWTFVGKVMSLLFNVLSRLVIAFLPRSKCLLISWLQSPSAMILDALLNTGKKIKAKRNSCKLPRTVIQITLKRTFPNQARKIMTNLDSILKSKDITSSTKVYLVKAMVFPVVMYGWGVGL